MRCQRQQAVELSRRAGCGTQPSGPVQLVGNIVTVIDVLGSFDVIEIDQMSSTQVGHPGGQEVVHPIGGQHVRHRRLMFEKAGVDTSSDSARSSRSTTVSGTASRMGPTSCHHSSATVMGSGYPVHGALDVDHHSSAARVRFTVFRKPP